MLAFCRAQAPRFVAGLILVPASFGSGELSSGFGSPFLTPFDGTKCVASSDPDIGFANQAPVSPGWRGDEWIAKRRRVQTAPIFAMSQTLQFACLPILILLEAFEVFVENRIRPFKNRFIRRFGPWPRMIFA
jgi:hypothetical protein